MQYYDEEHSLTVKTSALVETEVNHTSSHLKEILLDTLKQFNISKQQVLSCVVDNASNMTQAVPLLNEDEGGKKMMKILKKYKIHYQSTILYTT